MPLVRITDNALLGSLSLRSLYAACCCLLRFRCKVVGEDECQRPYEECVLDASGPYTSGDCDGQCQPPIPAYSCDPPCGPCEECGKCECVDTLDPLLCESCDGGNVVSSCGPCEQCIDGACLPCPLTCVNDQCVCVDDSDCPSGYVCINGVCVQQPYYCCIVTDTTVSPPVVTTICKTTPCDAEAGEEASGGPYKNSKECDDSCRKHKCTDDNCCGVRCLADANGPHLTKKECQDECTQDTEDDPCVMGPTNPYVITGVGAGTHVYDLTIDSAPDRKVCVQYVSTNCRPIRVQILADQIGPDGCTVTGKDVIKRDSRWRCDEDCMCGDLPVNQSCAGQPRGYLRWNNKQRCITAFKIRVFTLCDDNDWTVSVSCGPCEDVPLADCVGCCPPSCEQCDPCQTVQEIGLCGTCDSYAENNNGCTENSGALLSYPGKDCLAAYGRLVNPAYDSYAGYELGRGASFFAPCNSPFIGLCNKESPVADAPPSCVVAWPCEPTGIDGDCCDAAHGCAGQTGSDCDCGWANYELALKYAECGNPPLLWVDIGYHEEWVVDAACYCSTVTYTEHRIYRAFVYNCDTEQWDDKTADLLYKTEWKQYQLGSASFAYPVVIGGPPLVCAPCDTLSPDPTPDGDLPPPIVYVEPKVSAITCAPNAFP